MSEVDEESKKSELFKYKMFEDDFDPTAMLQFTYSFDRLKEVI